MIFLRLPTYQGAKKDFDKALEITPNIAYAHFFRGFTLAMLEDKQGAIAVKNCENVYIESISTVINYDPSINRLYTKAVQI
ncbi:MAG: hypothetical protein HEQ10_11675 [Dolichospermum sp. DEX182a]|nr:hypothetical protein [Dolichospermum sp. DEX182a]